jgi:N-acetylglutamate synthase-like GNAT family acetyltransferase
MRITYYRHYHSDKGILFCNYMGMALVDNAEEGSLFTRTAPVPISHGMIQLDPDNCVISNLSVSDEFRRSGAGNDIMKNLEQEATFIAGVEYVNLLVETGTFMHDWYSRLGYEEYSTERVDGVLMAWMRKSIQTKEQ